MTYAKKRFGQHFLSDNTAIGELLAAINVKPHDHLVEIGPGRGAITADLLARAHRLTAIELDRDLAALLRRRFASEAATAAGGTAPDSSDDASSTAQPPARFTLIEADALSIDLCRLTALAGERLRLVGNLPYNISSPLLFHYVTPDAAWADIHVMLQREVAERLCATPGQAAYGRLSVMLQYGYQCEQIMSLPPSSFTPPPKVHSAVVRMVPRGAPLPPTSLAALVRDAFNQRRKMLRRALADWFDDQDWIQLNIDSRQRAEELSVDDFIHMARYHDGGGRR